MKTITWSVMLAGLLVYGTADIPPSDPVFDHTIQADQSRTFPNEPDTVEDEKDWRRHP